MSKTYAGHTLAEIKEAAAQLATSPDVVLAMVARLEELERKHDAAHLRGFRAAQDMAVKKCDDVAEAFYSAAANRCAASIRVMVPPEEWSLSSDIAHSRSASSPAESDWPHPDGFPAIAGMP